MEKGEVHCFGFGQGAPIADVHEQAELAKMIEDVTGASDNARSSVEEKSAIVSEERKPELITQSLLRRARAPSFHA